MPPHGPIIMTSQSKSVTFFSWHFWGLLLHIVQIYRSKVSFTLVKGCTSLKAAGQQGSVCDPAKMFLTSKFNSYLLFSNPAHKTELGLRTGGRLLIVTYLDQSKYVANQQQVSSFAVPSTSLCIMCKNAGPTPFCWAQEAHFDFSSSNFLLQGTILSAGACAVLLNLPHKCNTTRWRFKKEQIQNLEPVEEALDLLLNVHMKHMLLL
jgi:hypothetical protein